MRRALWLSGAMLAAWTAQIGCGSVSDTNGSGGAALDEPCGEHPLDCVAGTTCWFASSGIFTCQPSGSGKEGDACAPIEDQPTCGDGLLCVKEEGSSSATCAELCDPTAKIYCTGGATCTFVKEPSGAATHVCL